MPRYYGSGGPAEWAQFQQGRRDDQLRDILNTMMALKQHSDESGWKQKEWDAGLSDTSFRQGQEERRTTAQENSAASLVSQRGEESDIMKQARILVETGQAKDLGQAIRMLHGIRTIDEEVALDKAKDRAKAGGGSLPSPNAQFDQTLNLQKQLTDYANFLETQIPKLNAEKAAAKANWETGGDTSQVDAAIADAVARLGKARSLSIRLGGFINKPLDPKLLTEAMALMGAGEEQAGATIPAPPQGFTLIKR